jgi:drug/metabolite transporter (DMT)-like permease
MDGTVEAERTVEGDRALAVGCGERTHAGAAALRGTLASLRTGQPVLTAGRAFVHFGAQLAWMLAVSMIPLVEVFALEFTSPLWVAVLAPLLLRERLTAWRGFAALVGFGGALVVVWPAGAGPTPQAFVEHLSLGTGSLLALASALGFALNVMAVRRLTRTDSPFVTLVWMHVLQLPLAAVLVLWGPGLTLSSTGAWVWTPGAEGEADTVTWASFFPDATAHPTLAAFEVFRAKARADWYVAGPGRGLRPGGARPASD